MSHRAYLAIVTGRWEIYIIGPGCDQPEGVPEHRFASATVRPSRTERLAAITALGFEPTGAERWSWRESDVPPNDLTGVLAVRPRGEGTGR
ncbi:DUF6303 family protein [Streptomyces sp. BI20]|uniref:DUF6303 family protein n=1 Tax=Streptomyces sp. BI20 TaxID=3403460 RepID=UPI003C79136D